MLWTAADRKQDEEMLKHIHEKSCRPALKCGTMMPVTKNTQRLSLKAGTEKNFGNTDKNNKFSLIYRHFTTVQKSLN